MKKFVLVAVAVAMLATTANAANLRMNFAPNPFGTEQEVTLAPSDAVDVEIWLDLIAGEDSVGILTAFEQPWDLNTLAYVPGAIDQTAHNTDLFDWTELGVDAPIGPEAGAARAAFGNLDNQDPITGAGSFLVGTATLHQTAIGAPAPGDPAVPYEIVFYKGGNFPTITQSSGAAMVYNVNYAGVYPGYWAFGAYGNPGKLAGKIGRNPLIINCVPEPGALALLALGGLSVLRRRR